MLVNSAEIIAHALLGFDVATLPPASLLSGQRFEQARISGVVEESFFDWVLEVPGGEAFIRTLARRLGRFDWSAVDHDVLKVLYESIIGTSTRKKLGEYYTPDWLAEQVVAATVTEPLDERVLDPACGSGTFLFHAVRRYLVASEDAGVPLANALQRLTDQVMGLDLHPVAVALARVTYLLAIGRGRLISRERGPITVPVYLGDSLQWEQRIDLYTADHLVIPTNDEAELFASELRFPDRLLADAARFDRLVAMLADLAAKPRPHGSVPSLSAVFRLLAIDEADRPAISETFATLCRLHDDGRNHIWSFYIRNLARPAWLSRPDNRVDVLVGNPPWLAYRNMPRPMQKTFKTMSESRGLWHGATVATNQDLSGLFVARTVQQYLREGGRFAFVMPNAALDRDQFASFREGHFPDPAEPTAIAFNTPWDLRRLRPHFFHRAACVVFGTRTNPRTPQRIPSQAEQWSGRLPQVHASWEEIEAQIAREPGAVTVGSPAAGSETSPYGSRFAQGATVVPRMLFVVEQQPSGPLGLAAGSLAVRSARSAYEKPPWKDLAPVEGVVESDFVRRLYLGEGVLPFRLLPPRLAVIPLEGPRLLDGDSDRIDLYPGLAAWWRTAEQLWVSHRSSDRLSLIEQLDYRRKLTGQFPAPAQRIVYAASGMHIAAARLEDATAVVEHSLYWASAASEEEALYLCAVLNSPRTTELVRPFMSYGKDERHIDKYVWRLPIPTFNADESAHQRLAVLGRAAEEEIAALDLYEGGHFPTLRRRIRQHLATTSVGVEINDLVTTLVTARLERARVSPR